jgi:hypothetical protein
MNRAALLLASMLSLYPCASPTSAIAQPRTFKIHVDSRVELLSLVFRLAGNPEYNQCRLKTYEADINQAFDPYKDHSAVRLARELRAQHGIGFDAVVSFGVSLTDPPGLHERVPLIEAASRWRIPAGTDRMRPSF